MCLLDFSASKQFYKNRPRRIYSKFNLMTTSHSKFVLKCPVEATKCTSSSGSPNRWLCLGANSDQQIPYLASIAHHHEEGKERVKIQGKKHTEKKKLGGATWATVMFAFPILRGWGACLKLGGRAGGRQEDKLVIN